MLTPYRDPGLSPQRSPDREAGAGRVAAGELGSGGEDTGRECQGGMEEAGLCGGRWATDPGSIQELEAPPQGRGGAGDLCLHLRALPMKPLALRCPRPLRAATPFLLGSGIAQPWAAPGKESEGLSRPRALKYQGNRKLRWSSH